MPTESESPSTEMARLERSIVTLKENVHEKDLVWIRFRMTLQLAVTFVIVGVYIFRVYPDPLGGLVVFSACIGLYCGLFGE